MARVHYIRVVLALCVWTPSAFGLECHTCSNVTNIRDCTATATCALGERCYTRQHGIGAGLTFELGCTTETECLQGSSIGLVGRSVRRQSACFQCCQVDRCNMNVCTAGIHVINEVGQCEDDPKFDCSLIATSFNLCGDVHHAKLTCRKYCNLCALVDGSWSEWSAMSKCDVTCGSGHMARTRTCTDPSPAHGGLDCAGNSTEIRSCVQNRCPIDGVWADWAVWSTCSETCGLGLQNRQRTCSNPKPTWDGNSCDGSPIEYKPCLVRGCHDGHWSDWEPWSNCTTTSSLKTRTRQCNNPEPSRYGRTCIGNSMEFAACPRQVVAFHVDHPNGTLVNGHPLFGRVVTNIGGSYDNSTGQFTCRVPGLYSFSVTVFITTSDQYVFCYICKNGHTISFAGGQSSDIFDSGSIQTYDHLSVDDIVNLCSCHNWSNVYKGDATSFNGALISPD